MHRYDCGLSGVGLANGLDVKTGLWGSDVLNALVSSRFVVCGSESSPFERPFEESLLL